MSDKTLNLTNAELELTQKIQRLFPRGIIPVEVIQTWTGCKSDSFIDHLLKSFRLIDNVKTIDVPANKQPFVVKDHFLTKDENPDVNVNIRQINYNFRKWFFDKVEQPGAESKLRFGALRINSPDSPIIAEFGGKEKLGTRLSDIFYLMEKACEGTTEFLPIDDYMDIFYVRDATEVLRRVSVNRSYDFWTISADSVAYKGSQSTWVSGVRFYSGA